MDSIMYIKHSEHIYNTYNKKMKNQYSTIQESTSYEI